MQDVLVCETVTLNNGSVSHLHALVAAVVANAPMAPARIIIQADDGNSADDIRIGSASVTAANGLRLPRGENLGFEGILANALFGALYAFTANAGQKLNILLMK